MNLPPEQAVEFDSLVEQVRRELTCAPGQRALACIAPGRDRRALEETFVLFEEARQFLRLGRDLGFSNLADPEPLLDKLAVEGVCLEPLELRALATLLSATLEARAVLSEDRERRQWPGLASRAESVGDFRALSHEIERKILPTGQIDSDASPQLKRIRQQIERTRGKIQKVLIEIVRTQRPKETLQDDFITIRGDRFVIPVRAGEKRRLPGVVHGSSASGQTVFVEPLETIELNNELVRLAEQEAAEIHRILRDLTAKLEAQRQPLVTAAETIGQLDLILAKARFAAEFDAVSPAFNEERRLLLQNVRHPVLEKALHARGENIVPITIELDDERRVLVVSGPNTGGKTVAVKTIGAATLAAQSGLPVAAERAVVPLYDEVLVDIGDQQSIQENLSTFSAHILNLRAMLERATAESLVLIDELGTGTDPAEGAALAMSILDRFRAIGCLTIATTHHQRLKAWAASTPSAANAAVEFDEVTLQPTYRLITGIPGVSSGIEIARRLGLPAGIISSAREALAQSDREAAELIRALHDAREGFDRLKRELEAERACLEEERRHLELDWMKTQRAKLAELERQFSSLMADADQRVRAMLEEIKQRPERARAEKQAVRKLAAVREEAKEALDAAVVAHLGETQPARERPRPTELGEGTMVRLRGLREPARVRQRPDEKTVEVEAGRVRMRVPLEDIVEVLQESEKQPSPRPRSVVEVHMTGRLDAAEEINVIGCTVDEALARVDKFLDNAFLAERKQVRVIHGHGTGALRKALAAMFKDHPLVERFESAAQEQGGAGVTVVELRL